MKKIVIWIKRPCFLQANTYNELCKMGYDIIMICEKGISHEREKNCSWNIDSQKDLKIIFLPEKKWRKYIVNFLRKNKKTIHIFGSLLPHKPKKVCFARKIASKMKLNFGILTEPSRNDYLYGIKKYIRNFQLFILKEYVKTKIIPFSIFYLCVSKPYDEFFDYLNIPKSKNFPFGYFPKDKIIYNEKIILQKNKLGYFNLFFVGSFTKIRDVQTIIKAIKIIKNENFMFKLYMVGYGNTYEEIIELSKKLDVYDNIIFLGPLDNNDERTIMKKMDLVIIPTLNASLGIPCLEAIHEGIPSIVSSGDRGASFFVTKSKSGFVYKNGDAISLSIYIKKILNNSDLRDILRKNAKSFSHKIEPKKIADYLLEIFDYSLYRNIYQKPLPPWEKQ